MFRSILVLETPWVTESVKSASVWPFISEFANAMDLYAYHQIFTDTNSFCHWINVFNKEKNITMPKLLYIAAHGGVGQICGLKNRINGSTIIEKLKKSKTINYVHFGSCLFGNIPNLESLLKKAKHIKMAAGYKKTVDWVDSTAFELMLWQRIATRVDDTKNLKLHTIVKEFVKDEVPGLAISLGFRCSYRYGKVIKTIAC